MNKEKGLDRELPKGFLGWWDCTEEDFFYEEDQPCKEIPPKEESK